MKIVDYKQGSKEWLEWRKKGIGSSDIAAIIGKSPYKTAKQLFMEKAGDWEQPDNYAMRRGRELEPEVRAICEKHFEQNFSPACAQHTDHEWAIASFDGMAFGEIIPLAVEIKCPGEQDHTTARLGLIPEKYFPQVQWQLFVSELPEMHYVSYYKGDTQIVTVQRDVEYQAMLFEAAKAFRLDLVAGVMPGTDLSEDLQKLFTDLKNALAVLKAQQAFVAELNDQLRDLVPRETPLEFDGIRAQWVKTRGTVDYESIPELAAVELDLYRKPEYYKFVVKNVKS